MSLRPRAAVCSTPVSSEKTESLSRALAGALLLQRPPPVGTNPPCDDYKLHAKDDQALATFNTWWSNLTFITERHVHKLKDLLRDSEVYNDVKTYVLCGENPHMKVGMVDNLILFYNTYVANALRTVDKWPSRWDLGVRLLEVLGGCDDTLLTALTRDDSWRNSEIVWKISQSSSAQPSYGRGVAAVAMVTNEKDKRVLVVQESGKCGRWMLPAGFIESTHRTAAQTAELELWEESGYRLNGKYPSNKAGEPDQIRHDPCRLTFVNGRLHSRDLDAYNRVESTRGKNLFRVEGFDFSKVNRHAIFEGRKRHGHGGGETRDYGFLKVSLQNGTPEAVVQDYGGKEKPRHSTGRHELRPGTFNPVSTFTLQQ